MDLAGINFSDFAITCSFIRKCAKNLILVGTIFSVMYVYRCTQSVLLAIESSSSVSRQCNLLIVSLGNGVSLDSFVRAN